MTRTISCCPVCNIVEYHIIIALLYQYSLQLTLPQSQLLLHQCIYYHYHLSNSESDSSCECCSWNKLFHIQTDGTTQQLVRQLFTCWKWDLWFILFMSDSHIQYQTTACSVLHQQLHLAWDIRWCTHKYHSATKCISSWSSFICPFYYVEFHSWKHLVAVW